MLNIHENSTLGEIYDAKNPSYISSAVMVNEKVLLGGYRKLYIMNDHKEGWDLSPIIDFEENAMSFCLIPTTNILVIGEFLGCIFVYDFTNLKKP